MPELEDKLAPLQATRCFADHDLAPEDAAVWVQQLQTHCAQLLDDHNELLAKAVSSTYYVPPLLEKMQQELSEMVANGNPPIFESWWESKMARLRKENPLRWNKVQTELQQVFNQPGQLLWRTDLLNGHDYQCFTSYDDVPEFEALSIGPGICSELHCQTSCHIAAALT